MCDANFKALWISDNSFNAFFGFFESLESFFDTKTGSFELSCNSMIKKDSQAFLCYGPQDNTFLAREYGLEENNIYDYVDVLISKI